MPKNDMFMPSDDNKHLSGEVRTIGLLLIDGFALMSYAAVIEPYRAANILAERPLYRWIHISTAGETSHASNGATIVADQTISHPIVCDTLFVVAGGAPEAFDDRRTFAWLREMAGRGIVVAGISAGPYILARAGLLESHRCTVHWEHRDAFIDAFPTARLEAGLYVIDRRRLTCAGGMAGMDLALDLIEREQGHDLSAKVSDWFIRTEPRAAHRPQRMSLRDRYRISNDRLLKALAHMEANVEVPVSREALARVASVSVRQLERMFELHLEATISETYQRIRLDEARHLLRSTTLATTEVAVACGFKSVSHFSRSFKQAFSRSPSDERRKTQS